MLTGNSTLITNTAIENIPIVEEATLPVTTKDIVGEYFKNEPVMVDVARCESTFVHFTDSGTVLRGRVDNRDIGVMQINEYYHRKTAEKLGLDIETLEGNLAYAKYLYDKQGLQPWSASSKCWSKSLHLAAAIK